MESLAIVGDSPVCENLLRVKSSRSGHVKSWLNMGGPSSKAKYSQLTDSEPVPWGKGEKNPDEGSEIEPETVNLQAVEPRLGGACIQHVEPRAFCIMSRLVIFSGEAKPMRRSRRETESE